MNEMFAFVKDMNNYEDRVVNHSEINDAVIDTARISDGKQPYETGITSAHYNDGQWVIVAAYDTVPDGLMGHDHWTALFSHEYEKLPEKLQDCQNALLMEFFDPEELCFPKT